MPDAANLASLTGGAGGTAAGGTERLIAVPVADPAWPHALAAQVQMFAAANLQSATLKLSPEHLGPVEVRIDLQSSQINVSFIAAHPETRTALEQSVPALRAMLASDGLTLGQAQVQPESRSASQSFAQRAGGNPEKLADEPAPIAGVSRGRGLIDEYA